MFLLYFPQYVFALFLEGKKIFGFFVDFAQNNPVFSNMFLYILLFIENLSKMYCVISKYVLYYNRNRKPHHNIIKGVKK